MRPDRCHETEFVDEAIVPPGAPVWITPELVALTLKTWQPYYTTPLSSDDAVIMIQSAGQLFGLLRRE